MKINGGIMLKTRHYAILGATALGITGMITNQSSEIITASIGLIGASFVWDKIEKNLSKGKK
jgi:hypothetical protein